MSDKEYLALYSENCKRCKYLDPQEKRRYKCHYTKGNKHCPAAEVQIVIVGRAMRYAEQVRVARDKRDTATELKVLSLVSKQSDAFKERFYSTLENSGEKE
jgi:hypothetical protein